MKRSTKHPARRGHLFIIGGAEDREEDKVVLTRLVEMAGGKDIRVAVLTAASNYHDEMWTSYDQAFGDLGVDRRVAVHIETRDDANDEARAQAIYDADLIFMTGGDQKKLLALIGGTRIDRAMHRALRE